MTETTPEGIVNPPIDQLLEHVDSKYRLVLFAAKRAHEMDAEEIAAQAAAAQEAPAIELDDPFADLADPNA